MRVSRSVPATHGRQPAPRDASYEFGFARDLRSRHSPDELMALFRRFNTGDEHIDQLMRRTCLRALARDILGQGERSRERTIGTFYAVIIVAFILLFEATLTAELLGEAVHRIDDVGVAGLHRLFRHRKALETARVIVVVAGMEGALPSVVAGLVDCPIVGVPTSTGYGTGAGGYAALLAMLNSCAAGVAVVNIDNGYGAGVLASLINRRGPARRGIPAS